MPPLQTIDDLLTTCEAVKRQYGGSVQVWLAVPISSTMLPDWTTEGVLVPLSSVAVSQRLPGFPTLRLTGCAGTVFESILREALPTGTPGKESANG